ncbi:hypothetical protein DFR86_00665 [Acidianus sulfidivorans JP7]|uniref:Uncharacterized protein n=1 Tax=Acidianus sulfidivorans JP7 TaxID=619593 RepID=A0A2U9IJP1_9CREN|nr:hypothetical protein [Acidianus sulfidivorans]AWR96205.1 hypothetical protein DFR86_00665 [Acidianus sulfidivorans JP7]
MENISALKNELTEEDLINDYLVDITNKLDQKIIEARRNFVINQIEVPYYLELEKEIRLIFTYSQQNLLYLISRREYIKSIEEQKRKTIKIIIITSDFSSCDYGKIIKLCENDNVKFKVDGIGEKTFPNCEKVILYAYKGWIIKNFEIED